MATNTPQSNTIERPPVIAVMGHIDHGKSKLLDYIRKSNVVEGESGGITQHISAYEVLHTNDQGEAKKITFLDTPGHAAFSGMRTRGVDIADIAILIISAEDGVKAQTLEAYEAIKKSGRPFIVAINKIDKPNANVDRTKNELVEHGIYLEGYGGDIPYVPISAVTGEGVPALLDMMLLVAEISELRADPSTSAEGFVLESNVDPKRGISATLIIKNGTLAKGMAVAAGGSVAPVRAIEDFTGTVIEKAGVSAPVAITGFDAVPEAGMRFFAFDSKKEAEEAARENTPAHTEKFMIGDTNAETVIPVVLKADVVGSLEAIKKELSKITCTDICVSIIHEGVGDIGENDINIACGAPGAVVLGFRVAVDAKATRVAENFSIPVETFAIIYNITDHLEVLVKERTPKKLVAEPTGRVKILKTFSKTKTKQVVGGRVEEGMIEKGARVHIFRRDAELGTGAILELQKQKVALDKITEGEEFGALIDAKTDIAPGDVIEPFIEVEK